jgi:hypothetical protein
LESTRFDMAIDALPTSVVFMPAGTAVLGGILLSKRSDSEGTQPSYSASRVMMSAGMLGQIDDETTANVGVVARAAARIGTSR